MTVRELMAALAAADGDAVVVVRVDDDSGYAPHWTTFTGARSAVLKETGIGYEDEAVAGAWTRCLILETE